MRLEIAVGSSVYQLYKLFVFHLIEIYLLQESTEVG